MTSTWMSCAGVEHGTDLLGQPREVGREDGGRDLDFVGLDGHQIGWSIESPQALHCSVAWEDMRTIVECSPQFSHTEVSSKRCRQ
jgi:hypothetical protein